MTPLHVPRLHPAQALLLGGLTVGTVDILDAIVFFGARGVSAERILQSIAAGLLGREAFDGGLLTAVLGLVLHYFIAFAVAGTFLLASGRSPALRRNWVAAGLGYGVLVYAMMNFVVLPLSRAGHGHPSFVVLLNGLLIHAFGVGLPSAYAARLGSVAES